jgi:hypothetical protein
MTAFAVFLFGVCVLLELAGIQRQLLANTIERNSPHLMVRRIWHA